MLVGLAMIAGGSAAGLFGSLLGLGGGTLLVPVLTLGFGLPLREAVAVSLVSVIVTSSVSSAVYLERHTANLRLGMTLELFSALGAIVGGVLAFSLDERELAGLFALLLAYAAISMLRRREPEAAKDASPAAATSGPDVAVEGPEPSDGFVDRLSGPGYQTHNLGFGMAGSVVAGVVSALLGIGGGTVKVPVMHLVMGVPLRVATATSNLMMGITASASAIIYLFRGGIDPYVAGPTAIGVFLGASVGSRIAHRIDVRILRLLFAAVLLYTAYEMLMKALG
jgi:uncharacterized membrane protein YfcA